jgi:hypothetical protein|tara:strand:- start:302 stop:562 length:261 start_codon:yes stop_codon:yes gene_type:complete
VDQEVVVERQLQDNLTQHLQDHHLYLLQDQQEILLLYLHLKEITEVQVFIEEQYLLVEEAVVELELLAVTLMMAQFQELQVEQLIF